MRLLITGCLGFIGSHLFELAKLEGHVVFGMDGCYYSARKKNLPLSSAWQFGDITSPSMVNKLLNTVQPDVLINCAAETHVARSITSAAEFLSTNVLGTHVLLEECLAYWRQHPQFKLVQVSTDEVYGTLVDHPDQDPRNPWSEESPYQPNNPYAASKAAGDCLVRSYWRTYGLPSVITHCGNNYGPRQHPEKLIPTLVRTLLHGEQFQMHGDGQQVRDWVYVNDHCSGLLLAAEKGVPGETYNFGGGCCRSNRWMAHAVHTYMSDRYLSGRRIAFEDWVVPVEDRPGNDRYYALNSFKARTDLGWQRSREIEGRLRAAINWYVQNPNYGDEYEQR